NFLVAVLSESLPRGHKIIAGGRRRDGKPIANEIEIDTPGGILPTRRPDILVQTPSGELYAINVGLANPRGRPVPREMDQIRDLQNRAGIPTFFYAYGVRS